jgi:succinoglycan biosynthesis protein ExoO
VLPEAGYLYTSRAGSISNRLDPGHARALACADAAFLARHCASMTPRERALFERRQRRLQDLGTAEAFLGALRRRRLGEAARALGRRPRAIGRVLRQTWAAARRRLV